MSPMSALGTLHVTAGHTEEGVFLEAANEKITPSFRHGIQLMRKHTLSFQYDTLPFQNPTIISILSFLLQHLPVPKSQSSHEQLKPYCFIQKRRACFRHSEAVSLKCLRQRKQVNLDFSYLQQQRAKERQSINTISFSSNL